MSIHARLFRSLTRLQPAKLPMVAPSLWQWAGRLPGSGWYMLEFQLAEARGARHLLLSVDCGEGFDPALSVTLPLRRGKVAKRICYFPSGVRDLQLEVIAADGDPEHRSEPAAEASPEVQHCCLAWLAPYFARDRLCQRLANMHRDFRGQTIRTVRWALAGLARNKRRSWRSLALSKYAETFHKRCPEAGYAEWLAQVEVESMPAKEEVAAFLAAEPRLPEFRLSLHLTPACAESGWRALCSLLGQSYSHWKLDVALCPSLGTAGSHVAARVAALAAEDERVWVLAGADRGADFAWVEPVALAGLFVAELPAHGRLHQHALFLMARAIVTSDNAQLVYSDSDCLNRAGGRESPLFKPGWNPDLLLAYNYIGRFCFFRSGLLAEAGTALPDVASTYARLLRCRDLVDTSQVVRIPRVLYHEKPLPAEDSASAGERDREALLAYLQASATSIEVTGWQGFNHTAAVVARCRWPVPEPAPLVSLLVPTRDGVEILRQCVDSILQKTDYPNFEILILDNQSRCRETLAYLESVQSDTRVQVHRWNHPFNYSAINNFGATLARGSILGLVNNDIEVISADWLTEMVSHASRKDIGCVGAKLYYGNDTVQHGGVILGIGGAAGHSHKYALRDAPGYMGRLQVVQNLSAVTAACLLLRKAVFEQVGGLNEEDLAIAYNDVDLCLKVREAGYRNLWTPYAELYHHESVSRGADDTMQKRRRAQREADYMRKRWGEQLDSDPAYNPNLTLVHEDFSLA